MKKSDRFDGFTVNVFSDEDGEYVAHFVELPNVSAFGESPEQALTELATAWNSIGVKS
jgi:predicted RNase H-like HicB family nuclease